MLLIHAPRSPRADYALDLFFGRLIPVPYRVTDDAAALAGHDGPALGYGETPADPDVPFVRAHGLLGRSGIEPVDPQPFRWRDTLALFPTADPASLFPFDPFAAAFYLASRYEEYLIPDRDRHGRFRPERSVLFEGGFLRRPVVGQMAAHLREALVARYPRFPWPAPASAALSTIDVDVPFAYRGRPLGRAIGAAGRQLLRGEVAGLGERVAVLRGRRSDPYDTFDWLAEVHRRHDVPLLYFLLLGRGGLLDRNLDPDGPEMRALVPRLAAHADLGLHPSYRSNEHPEDLAHEAAAFERLAGRPAQKSRQHFLRLGLPETYRRLLRLGITADYTMGYASEPGFRAGLAHPFPFYDLEAETATALTIYPITYMDGTLNVYQRLAPEEALGVVEDLAEAVRATGGLFVSLWHNDTVRDRGLWAGWRRVFLRTLELMAGL